MLFAAVSLFLVLVGAAGLLTLAAAHSRTEMLRTAAGLAVVVLGCALAAAPYLLR